MEPMSVLLIEDKHGDALLIREMLVGMTNNRFKLETTDQLSTGLERYAEGDFEVILLDLTLPDSDGLDALKAVCRQAPEAPIVVLTGWNDEATGLRALRAGAQDYLIEGEVDPQMIMRSIRHAIERKRSMLELQAANEQLRETNTLTTSTIEDLTHELRTPIFILEGYVRLLLHGGEAIGPLNAQQRQYLRIAERQVEKLTRLTEAWAVVSSKKDFLSDAEPVEASALLKAAVDDARMKAEEQEITLTLDVAPGLPQVMVNRMAIAQVLDNLLSNALKFTPPGGEITVRAGLDDTGRAVRVLVADTGLGISEEEHERIFERFYQVNDPKSRKNEGLGLGLAVCKKIIEAHGETIRVESAPNEGATFIFTLPVSWQPALETGPLSGNGSGKPAHL